MRKRGRVISDMSAIAIKVQGLFKKYPVGLFKKKKVAIRDVTFTVKRGEVFGIVGRNGAGKSTLLKSIVGFIKPSSGNISIDRFKPCDLSSKKIIGFLPESPCLYQNLTVWDHLRFIGRTHNINRAVIKNRGNKFLKKLWLSDVSNIPIRKFSKGMVQRAALACALFSDPEVIILDEPMSGLDPLGRRLVIDLILEYHNKKKTILFCSHILTDVERICDRIGIMDKGQIKDIVFPKDLIKDEHLTSCKGDNSPLESHFLKIVNQDDSWLS